ncbi:MAG: bis(5'-nucleosyl)-tetraphosphatase (symmetrical) YqeK [Firmicutes bacterium]|nr:bis(5'-nucleosyl)-tetraphosphatase (symmetrical) YqeK [Bacillota bacterium]
MTLAFYRQRLKEMLSAKRFEHSLRVMDTAVQLAAIHGVNARQAALAGLLHDCARSLSGETLLTMAREFKLSLHEVDLALPMLLHAPVGACLLRRDFGIADEAVLRAVSVHTLGDEQMTLLDQILFVADKIEPGRQVQEAAKLWDLAHQQLGLALLQCYDLSVSYALSIGDPVHPQMIEARNRLLLDRSVGKI